jgi:hypothetical protein
LSHYITREQVEEMIRKHESDCQRVLPLTYIKTPKTWKVLTTLGTIFVVLVGSITASLGVYYTDTRGNREDIRANNIKDVAQDSLIMANRREIKALTGDVRHELRRQTRAFNKVYLEMKRNNQ